MQARSLGHSSIRHVSGFTLLELVVVLAIMGLVLAVVPPLVSGAASTAELKAAARDLAAGLRYARSLAIARNQEVALELDVDARWYRVIGFSPERRLPGKLDFKLDAARSEFSDEHTGAIRFFSDGSSTGGRITVSLGERAAYEVDVNWLLGRVTIAQGRVGG